ncbi:Dockerin type I repeat protein [Rubripirellula lacrimiformis]|uniref:Dockerin type I repeat protein n=1 Tax=Rubripirellula lacrimiformis TaxID=1930273 RepID=A0A517N667_9BACT|nr:dockerin type I domain-containing protein [Rubripirellula lacrimiformis]QDT02611.1 Dockerin type I repeat protein [Rubripirellula lacrimiformis]
MMAADSIGVTPLDTGEFLLGTVTVTPVFFESNGEIDPESQDWTTAEIDEVLAKVGEGVNWWSDMLDTMDTVHTLDFVIDETFARDPFESPYEPIDRNTNALNEYIGDFVTRQGYGDSRSIEEAVQRFNHDQRIKHDTDWAFTIFVVDSSDDPDGLFASGGNFSAAFAYAGGLFVVTPSTRPASTIAHEMGHIFWARDEYQNASSWTDQRGYYDAQNLNAADNPTPGFSQQDSIMRGGVPLTAAFESLTTPASTLAMVGWQDSDGDGVFDVADVPLDLDGIGYWDAEQSLYVFSGNASVAALRNQNSSGPQSDISLAEISELQYRLDDGSWLVADTPHSQTAMFDLTISIADSFDSIQFRVIDTSTGIASPIIGGTAAVPAITAAGITGVAFMDENQNGEKDLGEPALAATGVRVLHADGSPLLVGNVDAADFSDGAIPEESFVGVTLAADGLVSSAEVAAFLQDDAATDRVFHSYDLQRSAWIQRWSSKVALNASFDEPVGEVTVSLIGVGDASYGRVEAYDASGTLITRQTSAVIGDGESMTVQVTDPRGQIASVRIFGHADTSVAIKSIDFGFQAQSMTELSGGFRLPNLPDGDYQVVLDPERAIHSFGSQPLNVSVVAGTSSILIAAAQRVDSPRHNLAIAEDANQDGEINATDALVIINDLARSSPRLLAVDDTEGFDVDVNNDGAVSALDALVVINALARQRNQAGNGESEANGGPDSALMTDLAFRDFEARSATTTPDPSTQLRTTDSGGIPLLGPFAQAERIANPLAMFNFDDGIAVNESVGTRESDTADGGKSSAARRQRTAIAHHADVPVETSDRVQTSKVDELDKRTLRPQDWFFRGIEPNILEPETDWMV